jgi:hypothetical protein
LVCVPTQLDEAEQLQISTRSNDSSSSSSGDNDGNSGNSGNSGLLLADARR